MVRSSPTTAATAMIVGGLLSCALYPPFTAAHGPTSINIEREVLGWDMHNWGFLLGTVPQVLIGLGLWRLREVFAGERRIAVRAISVMCVAMFLFAVMNLAFRAIGPPFDLFLLVPAGIVVVATARVGVGIRLVLALIVLAYVAGLVLTLIPLETFDSFNGYRIFGVIVYVFAPLLWAGLGAALVVADRRPDAAAARV